MLILTGNNLGERHRDLNTKVNEAVENRTDLEEVVKREEKCDVDKLFKIEFASRHNNIEYIMDVLKSSDVFYITRALNCEWIYKDEYSDYINANYLENSIFPHMSMKMKRKMITTISIHLRNGERAIEFYTYCRDAKMKKYAHKFLVFTPISFKLDILRNWDSFNDFSDDKYLKQFIDSSFEVAQAYIALCGYSSHVIYQIRFMYSVSDKFYLNIFEKYDCSDADRPNRSRRLGIRISKDILKRHRNRVMKHPVTYINQLNKSMLIRYLTTDNVKALAFALLPSWVDYFWSIDFYQTYQFLLSKIPTNELFAYLKKIFTSKYNNAEFEMSIQFFQLEYYKMLTIEEQEEWALRHIERDQDWPGMETFMWYKYVSFKKAFPGIKRYIFLTPDKDRRSTIVNILPETTRNQDDIMNLLNYYYQRHVNESEEHKESFINKIIAHHDIYSFDTECWTLLDKLLYSLEVYTTGAFIRLEYKLRSMFYRILHNMDLPEALQEYIKYVNYYEVFSIIQQLSQDRNTVIAKYLMNYYTENIKTLMDTPQDDTVNEEDDYCNTVSYKIGTEVHRIWEVIYCFKRDHDECPEIALQHMKSNIEDYKSHVKFKPKFIARTEGDFLRWLKKDIKMSIDGISEIRCNAYRWIFRLSRLFRKLKVYFPNDVAKDYLEYFKNYLSNIPKGFREYRNIKMAVVGVFYLADEDFKTKFMKQYVPETPKIDHMNIDNRLLQTQKAICRLAYHSRPPLLLSDFLKYITGDYVHYCLPVFNNYLANSTCIMKFIEAVLDAPLSIQKHGLRLAFITYSPETLKQLIIDVWKKTKNVSLRMLLYETLFFRIVNETEEAQNELYDVLKLYTSELNKDDHDNVYSLLVSDELPDKFKGDFIQTAWLNVSQLLDKTLDLKRKTSIICHMENYIHLVEREFPRIQVIDDHVQDMLFKKNIKTRYFANYLGELMEAKWNLTAKYIVSFSNKEEQRRSLELMRTIIVRCLKLWNFVDDRKYTLRKFIRDFIEIIMEKDPKISEQCAYMVPIYQCMLDELQKSLKKEQTYLIVWQLKLSIACRKIIHDGRNIVDAETGRGKNLSSVEIAEVFAAKVAKMIIRLVDKREFHHCFYHSLANIISNIGSTICDIICEDHSGFNYYISNSLTNFQRNETHVIALLLLPTDPSYHWTNVHRRTIEKIKKFDSDEIRSFVYDKYVLSDYCVRDYI